MGGMYEKTYRIYLPWRPGFRYATKDLKVVEDKKLFYSDFEVSAYHISHQIITTFYGGAL